MARCLPCQQDHHAECEHTLEHPCDCFVCIAADLGTRSFNGRRRRHEEQDPGQGPK